MGLQFSATHPHKPSPTRIFNDERTRKFSPLTSSGKSQPLRFTNTAMESYGTSLRNRIDKTESVSLRLSEFPRSWLKSNMACASCRADAIDVRKSDSFCEVSAHFSNPVAGARPRST